MTAPTPPKNDWVAKDTAGYTAADWTVTPAAQNNIAAWITYLNTQNSGKQAQNANLTAISALVDPNTDKLIFWDDSAGTLTYLTLGTNLSITGTTINAAGGAGGATNLTTTVAPTQVTVNSDTGSDATIPAATGSNAGVMSAAQQVLLTGAIQTSTKNVANGVAGLNASGQVAAAQLPGSMDELLEYANLAAFPVTGAIDKMYIALDTGRIYRWGGTVYGEIPSSPGTTDVVAEGTTNLYYTNARADARVVAGITGKQPLNANLTSISTLVDPNADRLAFWDDSAGAWAFLTLGTNLSITGTTLNATGGAGSGDVVGPASATDNAVARYDTTTGKLLQTSLASVDDSGNVSALNTFHSFATTVTAAGITTLTVASARTQEFTGTTTQTVRLPTTGVPQGASWVGINNSTGVVTVQSSGANTVLAMGAGTTAVFTARIATPTTAANWTAAASVTGAPYTAGGADVALADGGTGASLVDPNADRILFWDDSAGSVAFLAPSTGVSITGTSLTATGGTGGATNVPSGWADIVRDHGAVGDGVTNDRAAFIAAAATTRPVWVPAGTYFFSGAGISDNDLVIAGAGTGKTLIALGAGSYFIDGSNDVNTLKLSGITFDGGAGVFRSTYNDTAVRGYRIFEDCRFHSYTATCIGHRHTDSPYWVFRDCEFRGANDSSTIGVALNGLNDDNLFHHCSFELNRIHIKLKEGANAHISGGCSFMRFLDYTSNPRIDIWLVPRTQAEITAAEGNYADAGSGFSVMETKFGNEGLAPNDYRVVIADALAGNFETALPNLAANSTSVWICGTFTNLHNSLIGGTCPPFIYSTTPNLYGIQAGNFAHIGSDSLAAARVLQLRTATGFDPTVNAIGPVMTTADPMNGQVLVAATSGTLTGQPKYIGGGS